MRPTRAGLAALLAGPGLLLVGRVLGLLEVTLAGLTVTGLAVGAGVWGLLRPCTVTVTRTISPMRASVGRPCTVELTVRNRGSWDTPVLRFDDPVDGTPGAEIGFAPVRVGATATARYRLPTDRRGVLGIGPATLTVTDPFGLFARVVPAAPRAELTVLPHVDAIPALTRSMGTDPEGSTDAGALGRAGEEFTALRPYVVGDDLRRVHWLSSARRGDLLVRQHDVPRHGRVCVLLDLRPHAGGDATLEPAVSAAASIVRTQILAGDHVRLVTTDAVDSGFGTGQGHLDALLNHLALALARARSASLRSAIRMLGARASGALVVVTRAPAPADLQLLETAAPGVGMRRIVRFDHTRTELGRTGTEVLGIGPDDSFAELWSRATAPGRRRPPAHGRPAGSRAEPGGPR